MTTTLTDSPLGVNDAKAYSLPYSLVGVLNPLQPRMTPPQLVLQSALFSRPHADAADHFPALGTIFHWVLNQQSEDAKARDDYMYALNWLSALRTGDVSLREQAWPEPHNHSTPNARSLIELVRSALGIERACILDAGVRINHAAYGIFDAQRVIVLAASRSSDPEAFYANLADVVLKALHGAK